MFVGLVMLATFVVRRAFRRIRRVHRQLVFLDAGFTHVVEMALVQVVGVTVVLDGGVSAV
jgi:hypothetical protein